MKREADPQKAHEAALAFAVARLTKRQYEVFRLFSLFGPLAGAKLEPTAYIHGVRGGARQLGQVRDELVALGLLTVERTSTDQVVWSATKSLMPSA